MKLLTALALLLAVTATAMGSTTATSQGSGTTTVASAGDPSQWS